MRLKRGIGQRGAACRRGSATVAVLVCAAGLLGAFSSGAIAARAARVHLAVSGASVERVELCGRSRIAVTAPLGSRSAAVVKRARGTRLTLLIQRCVEGAWTRAAKRGMSHNGRRYRIALDTSRAGDFRIRARVGAASSRSVYVRVGDGELRVRKDVAQRTAAERTRFVDALLKLQSTPSPYDSRLSWYDQFVDWHAYLSKCDPSDPLADRMMMGHAGPIHNPWHRYFVLLLERALSAVSETTITVPYWDWTNPASTRAVFAEDFMGGDGDPKQDYAVTTGPFRKGRWQLKVMNFGMFSAPSNTTYITRHMGSHPLAPTQPTASDVAAALRAPVYDVAPFDDSSDPQKSFRNALEGYRAPLPVSLTGCPPDGALGTVPTEPALHNRAHLWVGGVLDPSARGALRFGTMTVLVASPNDPVFFLHHSNLDRIWAQWQQTNGIDSYRPVSGYAHNSLHDVMHPFEQTGGRPTPADVADIQQLGYRYTDSAARPIETKTAHETRWLVCRITRT